MFSSEGNTLQGVKGMSRSLDLDLFGVVVFGVKYPLRMYSLVFLSDDSGIRQAYDMETDSVLTGPIVSFCINDEAQMVLVAIGRFRGQ